MCIEEMNQDDVREALIDTDREIKFYTDDLKRITRKLKTLEFFKKELIAKTEEVKDA